MHRHSEASRYKSYDAVTRKRITALCKSHLTVIDAVDDDALRCILFTCLLATLVCGTLFFGCNCLYLFLLNIVYFRLYDAVEFILKPSGNLCNRQSAVADVVIEVICVKNATMEDVDIEEGLAMKKTINPQLFQIMETMTNG